MKKESIKTKTSKIAKPPRKTYIIDTNVLLSDPESLFAFAENEVILPLTVIEEVDKNKTKPSEAGANARATARKIADMIKENPPGTLKTGLTLKNGGLLRIVSIADLPDTSKMTKDWDETSKDNHILQVCYGLFQKSKKDNTPAPIFVTRDILLRVKCDFLEIPCEDYRKSSVASNPDRIFTGTCTANVPPEVIQSFFEAEGPAENNTEFHCVIDSYIDHPLSPNEFITLKGEDDSEEDSGAVVKYVCQDKPLKLVRQNKKPVFGLIPRNKEQALAMELLLDDSIKLVTLIGKAGSGKTLLSVAAGLNLVLEKKKYKSLVICRPVVPVGNDIGFLPGSKEEKLEPWIAPIKDNLRHLLFSGRKGKQSEETLQNYFENGIIEVEAITYLRGRSIADALIIIDEAQNLTAHELKTIITRVGDNTKIILTGDVEQIDNMYIDSVSNGLAIAVEKFKPYELAAHITLVKGERSPLASLAAQIL